MKDYKSQVFKVIMGLCYEYFTNNPESTVFKLSKHVVADRMGWERHKADIEFKVLPFDYEFLKEKRGYYLIELCEYNYLAKQVGSLQDLDKDVSDLDLKYKNLKVMQVQRIAMITKLKELIEKLDANVSTVLEETRDSTYSKEGKDVWIRVKRFIANAEDLLEEIDHVKKIASDELYGQEEHEYYDYSDEFFPDSDKWQNM